MYINIYIHRVYIVFINVYNIYIYIQIFLLEKSSEGP